MGKGNGDALTHPAQGENPGHGSRAGGVVTPSRPTAEPPFRGNRATLPLRNRHLWGRSHRALSPLGPRCARCSPCPKIRPLAARCGLGVPPCGTRALNQDVELSFHISFNLPLVPPRVPVNPGRGRDGFIRFAIRMQGRWHGEGERGETCTHTHTHTGNRVASVPISFPGRRLID